ncbi:MAG: L-aspartate oxidase, partial [Gammaproteobacteria bacterium]
MPYSRNYDVLIVGSGGAGLSLALKLADYSTRVAVLSKFALTAGSTYYAQGGISAVFDAEDSIESHIEDTLDAGAGLCNPDIVRLTVTHGKSSIDWLRKQGVVFTEEQTESGEIKLHLNREGGHSHRRVVHTADATGKAVSLSLIERAQEHSNIELFEHHNVVELITAPSSPDQAEKRVVGAYVLDTKKQQVKTIAARVVVLATGGASKVYLYSTNPQSATGDGIALAWRAGCRISNMEFMQFHPTCLYHPHAQSFLISEAVRGEGGKLILPDGSSFMHNFDPRGELAPRDIVARAIDHEIKKRGIDCVYLDISHKSEEFIREHFPTIYRKCLKFDIDITKQPIPVVPAAHYTCGGVLTDSYARTDVVNLYAIGEVASTGLHGANRMASNSLLECLVFADRASEDILQKLNLIPPTPKIPDWDESQVSDSDEEVVVSHNWN